MNTLSAATHATSGIGSRAVEHSPQWEKPTVRLHLTITARSTYDSRIHANAEEAIGAKVGELKAHGVPFTREGLTLRWKDGEHDVAMRYEDTKDAVHEREEQGRG